MKRSRCPGARWASKSCVSSSSTVFPTIFPITFTQSMCREGQPCDCRPPAKGPPGCTSHAYGRNCTCDVNRSSQRKGLCHCNPGAQRHSRSRRSGLDRESPRESTEGEHCEAIDDDLPNRLPKPRFLAQAKTHAYREGGAPRLARRKSTLYFREIATSNIVARAPRADPPH